MKTILFSFFNSNNIGDLLISETVCRELSTFSEVVRADLSSSFEICGSYNYPPYSILERAVIKLCSMLKIKYTTKRRRCFLKRLGSELTDADLLVFGGGNLLMDLSSESHSSDRIADYIKAAEQCKVDCVAVGIGFGPFCEKRQQIAASAVLSKCRSVSFRDRASLELFLEAGGDKKIASVSADPVFMLPNKKDLTVSRDRIAVNIIAADWENSDIYKRTAEGYERLICGLSAAHPNKKITLFCTESKDRAMLCKLSYDKDRVFVKDVGSADDLIELYSESLLVIGARMHSLIVAYTQGLQVIGLAWQNKVREFFKITGQEGSCFELFDLNEDVIGRILEQSKQRIRSGSDHSNRLAVLSETARQDIQRLADYVKS